MNLFQIIFLGFQNAEQIKEKIENAPDEGYEIGVVIGTYLPFILFVIFAYIVYFKARNRKD
ncbi:MAG: hypothetical protein KAI79_20705 [Bacteroidales bacterium]|nr:hypothetical protein [Bacteroidales bacterium]